MYMENQNSLTSLELGFTRCTSTAHIPTSSAILIFRTQTGENTSVLPSSDTITDSDCVSHDLPIALRKVKRTCTSHPISRFISYSHLSPFFHGFIFFSLYSYFVPKSLLEALSIPG